jgi:hypothetical protein
LLLGIALVLAGVAIVAALDLPRVQSGVSHWWLTLPVVCGGLLGAAALCLVPVRFARWIGIGLIASLAVHLATSAAWLGFGAERTALLEACLLIGAAGLVAPGVVGQLVASVAALAAFWLTAPGAGPDNADGLLELGFAAGFSVLAAYSIELAVYIGRSLLAEQSAATSRVAIPVCDVARAADAAERHLRLRRPARGGRFRRPPARAAAGHCPCAKQHAGPRRPRTPERRSGGQ